MTSKSEPIRRRKLSHEVQDRLLKMIEDESLVSGDQFPSERELMASYGVGRPAIREAMQNLERMGLLEIRHGERPRVANPSVSSVLGQTNLAMRYLLVNSAATLDHLKSVRLVIESHLVRLAAVQAKPEDIALLEANLKNHAEAKKSGDIAGFVDFDGEFHRLIGSIAGNPIFEALSATIFDWLKEFHNDQVRIAGKESLTLKEHGVILDSIKAGDADAAEQAIGDHLNRVNKHYRLPN